MKSFLEEVVNSELKKATNLSEHIFVLPSQRACVFLKNEINNQLETTSILPKIVRIEDFIQEIGQINLIDNSTLLFEFYKIYKENTISENRDSFDKFIQWAPIALQDFNEIDSYLLDINPFFKHLYDVKRMDNWHLEKQDATELTKNYLAFFKELHIYYNKLYTALLNKKIGYQGLIYREAVNNIHFFIEATKTKKIVLVGFNALNKAEEHIFQELLESDSTNVYWDADASYFNSSNETGSFLRKYHKNWKHFKSNPFNWIHNNYDEVKNINIVGAPKNVSQHKYAGELLNSFDNFNNTALILADESTLSLTLNSLPKKVDKLNITMGLPLKDVPVYSFFESIFKLFINQEKLDKSNQTFYYKDVLNVLYEPIIQQKDIAILIDTIKENNYIFISLNTIESIIKDVDADLKQVLKVVFKPFTTITAFLESCLDIIDNLKGKTEGLEKEYLFRFYKLFQQLQNLNSQHQFIADLKTLHHFYNQIAKLEKLAFKGEPLEGLQLMGMLETRVLDFENIIITSVNEGILPSGKTDNSFIPFDIKKHYGLPTYQEKDAVFSYHFFRLLQRAKNVFILYNTEADDYGSNEKSRFVTQLEFTRNDVIKKMIAPTISTSKTIPKTVEKTTEVITKLKEYATKGISPSALANYIYNPLAFYHQKVLNIYEAEEVEETVAANTLGTVIHDVLHELYLPYIDNYIDGNSIKKMKLQVAKLVEKYFQKHYKQGDITRGKNKLIVEVAKSQVNRFLNVEATNLKQHQIKILGLEKEIVSEIFIEELGYTIKIKGIVDRIDLVDDSVRIIDYKTGFVNKSNLKIKDISLLPTDYKYTKALQVLLYGFMYQKTTKTNTSLQAGVYSFKNLKEGFIPINYSQNYRAPDYEITSERIDEFMLVIKAIIKEIFDPNIPFKENLDLPF